MGIFDFLQDGLIAYGANELNKKRMQKNANEKRDYDRDPWRKEVKEQDDYERDRYLYGDDD